MGHVIGKGFCDVSSKKRVGSVCPATLCPTKVCPARYARGSVPDALWTFDRILIIIFAFDVRLR